MISIWNHLQREKYFYIIILAILVFGSIVGILTYSKGSQTVNAVYAAGISQYVGPAS